MAMFYRRAANANRWAYAYTMKILANILGKPAASATSKGKLWRGQYYVKSGFVESGSPIWLETPNKAFTRLLLVVKKIQSLASVRKSR